MHAAVERVDVAHGQGRLADGFADDVHEDAALASRERAVGGDRDDARGARAEREGEIVAEVSGERDGERAGRPGGEADGARTPFHVGRGAQTPCVRGVRSRVVGCVESDFREIVVSTAGDEEREREEGKGETHSPGAYPGLPKTAGRAGTDARSDRWRANAAPISRAALPRRDATPPPRLGARRGARAATLRRGSRGARGSTRASAPLSP